MSETSPSEVAATATETKPGRKPAPARKTGKKVAKKADSAREQAFFGRDESWMLFNQRVLEEAEDPANPLLERVKFLAITASNLDEFIEIRVASLLQHIEDAFGEPQRVDEVGRTPQERLDQLNVILHSFVEAQYDCWNHDLMPALRAENIRLLGWRDLDDRAREYALDFYDSEVDPLLTPVTIDPSHPFPRVLNKALCIALLLRSKRSSGSPRTAAALGVVTVPRALPRLVPLPSADGRLDFIMLHKLIEAQVGRMFRGYEVLSRAPFRVTRNSNLYLQEEESRSVLESVRSELHNRRKGDAVRMEIEEQCARGNRATAAHHLRARSGAGMPHQGAGEPAALDESIQPGGAARS